jgi:uncharacterized integral membrane protein (TIGR00698 family)
MIKGEMRATTGAGAADSRLFTLAAQYIPGVAVAVTVALAAKFLEQAGIAPALIIALILGLFLSGVVAAGPASAGVDFAGKHILALGVALLGARLTLGDVTSLGLTPALVVVVAMLATLTTSWFCARALGLNSHVAVIAGCGTAVCGASAAVAASSVLPKRPGSENDTALVIIAVTVVSAVAMIVYPAIVGRLGLPAAESGIILGGSIHNVPQAVAAGYSLSDAVGNTATLTKLFRVALLGPIVIAIALAFGTRGTGVGSRIGVPWFILAFAAFVILGSFVAIPPVIKSALNSTSTWLLLIAIAAIGLKTSVPAVRKVGPRVLVLILANSAVLLLILACAAFAGLI